MGLKAVLFDLDNTLTHRGHSLAVFSPLFYERFSPYLHGETTVAIVSEALINLDASATITRDQLYGELLDRLPWQETPGFDRFRSFWHEPLTKLRSP